MHPTPNLIKGQLNHALHFYIGPSSISSKIGNVYFFNTVFLFFFLVSSFNENLESKIDEERAEKWNLF